LSYGAKRWGGKKERSLAGTALAQREGKTSEHTSVGKGVGVRHVTQKEGRGKDTFPSGENEDTLRLSRRKGIAMTTRVESQMPQFTGRRSTSRGGKGFPPWPGRLGGRSTLNL